MAWEGWKGDRSANLPKTSAKCCNPAAGDLASHHRSRGTDCPLRKKTELKSPCVGRRQGHTIQTLTAAARNWRADAAVEPASPSHRAWCMSLYLDVKTRCSATDVSPSLPQFRRPIAPPDHILGPPDSGLVHCHPYAPGRMEIVAGLDHPGSAIRS